MTAQQRDMIDEMLRNGPFDLGGDLPTQRPILEQMLTSAGARSLAPAPTLTSDIDRPST